MIKCLVGISYWMLISSGSSIPSNLMLWTNESYILQHCHSLYKWNDNHTRKVMIIILPKITGRAESVQLFCSLLKKSISIQTCIWTLAEYYIWSFWLFSYQVSSFEPVFGLWIRVSCTTWFSVAEFWTRDTRVPEARNMQRRKRQDTRDAQLVIQWQT